MTTATMIHVFEKANLGKAPFEFIEIISRRGPIKLDNGQQVGAPGQPMGTCDYCGTGIADCYLIESADGKRFEVGCECVMKTGDRGLKRVIDQATKDMNKKKADEKKARTSRKLEELLSDESVQSSLLSLPHPSEKMAGSGFTRLDWAIFMFEKAGDAGRRSAVKFIESLTK